MALTSFQRTLCQRLAQHRIRSGESYVAGAAALNELLGGARLSRDVDLFHDTESALDATWQADRQLLLADGYLVTTLRERPSFVEAEVAGEGERVVLQWVRDSAYRFFPLIEDPVFGLALHPFDLATNKVLALVGRLEVRDWIDVIHTCERLQPLGYLAWAACGKDPGFSPLAILEEASRNSHYSQAEVDLLAFEGPAPDATQLSIRWRSMVREAREVVALLPGEHVGTCVLTPSGGLCTDNSISLRDRIARDELRFHSGSIRGALPRFAPAAPY